MTVNSWLRPLFARLAGRPTRPVRRSAFRPRIERLEDRAVPATFTVTNTLDDGSAGSLRWAIIQAGADHATPSAPDAIKFAIPANDPNHFYYSDDGVPNSINPANRMNTTAADDAQIAGIDPDSHSWFSISPASPLPGIGYGYDAVSNTVWYDSSVVIDGYTQDGAAQNSLDGVGTLGQAPDPTKHYGDNAVLKIVIDGSNIPTSYGNQSTGLVVSAPASTVRGLAINHWSTDIMASGAGDKIEGNFLGTDVSGEVAYSSSYGDWTAQGTGVFVRAAGVVVGGATPAARNLISGFWGAGVLYTDFGSLSLSQESVQGNFIGTDRTGTRIVDGTGRSFGNYTGIVDWSAVDLSVTGNLISGSSYRGLDTSNYEIPLSLQVRDNFIGTDVTGTHALRNAGGLQFRHLPLCTVSVFNNLISGNDTGIILLATRATVEVNDIGSDVTGTTAVQNHTGIELSGDVRGTVIGGPGVGERNLFMTPNGSTAIADAAATGGRVEYNTFSSLEWAVIVQNGTGLTLTHNTYGGDRNNPLDPFNYGILLINSSGIAAIGEAFQKCRIGIEDRSGSNNTFGGNTFTDDLNGVVLSTGTTNDLVELNTVTGSTYYGVYVYSGSNNNVIRANTISGVRYAADSAAVAVDSGTGNRITGNSIFNNATGIRLSNEGNHGQPAPVLDTTPTGAAITGTLAGPVGQVVRLEFFGNAGPDAAGNYEGQKYLGYTCVTLDATGRFSATINVPADFPHVTATATVLSDPRGSAYVGDTSQFSPTSAYVPTPAPLTVTAVGAGKVYGEPNPAFGVIYSGFVLGQGPSALGGALTFTTAASDESAPGSYSVTPGGLTSANYRITYAAGTLTVAGATIQLRVDPADPTKTRLVVGGTPGDDIIGVTRGRQAGTLAVLVNCTVWQNVAPLPGTTFGQVVVYGGAGCDLMVVDTAVAVSAALFGGSGDDVLVGGGGNGILVGGAGNDILVAGCGSDILVGGAGSDILVAGNGSDLLIAGSTAYDASLAKLDAVQAVWASSDTYAHRVAALTDTGRPVFLQAGVTVFDDTSVDFLYGGSGQDWFWADVSGSGVKDRILDLHCNEIFNNI